MKFSDLEGMIHASDIWALKEKVEDLHRQHQQNPIPALAGRDDALKKHLSKVVICPYFKGKKFKYNDQTYQAD